LRIMLLTMWMAPLNLGGGALAAVDGNELRKKMPPARDWAFDSER
jgi:hypothetical protein